MNEEMNWEEYEKILMQRPGFKEALKETSLEYETAREKIKAHIRRLQKSKKSKVVVSQHLPKSCQIDRIEV